MLDYASFLPAQRLRPVLALSSDGAVVAYVSDASGQFNLWTQPVASGPARQLTFFTDQSVRQIAWAPDGTMLAFTADKCGDEQTQVYLISAEGGDLVRVSTAGDRQHRIAEVSSFDPSGRYLLYSGNDRDPAVADVIVHDLAGGPARRLHGIPGRSAYPVAISPDGRWVLAGAYGANTDFQAYLGDLTSTSPVLEPVTEHLPGSYYYPGPWDADSSGFFVRATAPDGDHICLGHISIADRTMTVVDASGWDVQEDDMTTAGDGKTVVWAVNEDGSSVLRGQSDGAVLTLPALPDGVVTGTKVSGDAAVVAFLLDTPVRPMEISTASLGGLETVRYLTDTRPPALDSVRAVAPELHHYPATDGTPIPALIYRPLGIGPHPVLMYIHGGPETQSRPAYDALFQCLLATGIGVMAPNVRGSSGYGFAWQKRIYRDWGGIDLADFAAGAAYLKSLDWVDAGRLAVMGKSYGGFAALSCMTRLPDLWAAGVSAYGPANLETLARSMPPDWATTVAAMIGDPDKNADRLRERSPVTYADQIRAPLLVIQGATDPRVPRAEAEQIVEKARANGAEVDYLVFEDEGHGFTTRANDIKAHTTVVEFLTRHLR